MSGEKMRARAARHVMLATHPEDKELRQSDWAAADAVLAVCEAEHVMVPRDLFLAILPDQNWNDHDDCVAWMDLRARVKDG